MTVTMVPTAGNLWQCLSTDTKPTGNTVEPGDALFETDTGRWFIFSNGAWSISNLQPTMRSR